MDWRLFATTFVTIFLAELGDKTQFAAIAAGSKSDSIGMVLLAVVLALALAGGLGVLFGRVLSSLINPYYMNFVSGGLFIIVGLWIIIANLKS